MAATQRYATTDPVYFHILAPGGQPVTRSYRALLSILRTISERHAALFAEPEQGERDGKIDWYGPATKRLARLDDLPDEEADAVRRDLGRLFRDIEARAEELMASDDPQDVRRGTLLGAALRIPSGEYIFVHDRSPVLTGWGTAPAGSEADVHVLRRLVETHEERTAATGEGTGEPAPPDETPTGETPPDGPTPGEPEPQLVGSSGETAERGSRTLIVRAALIVTLLGIALATAYLLISHCSINLPRFLTGGVRRTIVSLCGDDDPLADGAALRSYVDSMERELTGLGDACGSDSATAPPQAETPDAAPPPAPVRHLVQHKSPPPTFGHFCGIQVCNPQIRWTRADEEHESCSEVDPADLSLPDAPPAANTCYVLQVPTLILADPGTPFAGSAELFVNGQSVKSWQYEAEAVSQASVERGLREGAPVTYQVGRFSIPFRPE